MLVPNTELGMMILLIVSLLGWATWVGTLKSTGKKWRFEHFYYDFTVGVLLAAVVAAFTAGSWDQQELTFQDNFLLTGYRKMAWTLGSGIAFNLGNLLLLAAASVSGVSVAFPITFAVAWAIGAMWQFAARTDVNGMLSFSGSAVMVISAVLGAVAYVWYLEAEENKKFKALRADPRAKRVGPPPKSPAKAIVLAVIGGLVMSVFYPAIIEGTAGDNGVSAYGAMLLVAAGIFSSSLVLVPFFMNFPVEGEPIQVRGYFKGKMSQHLAGLLGGVIWVIAVLAGLVPEESDTIVPSPVTSYLLTRGGVLVAALLGLMIWRELPGSTLRVKMMLAGMVVMFLAGLGLIAVAPLYGPA